MADAVIVAMIAAAGAVLVAVLGLVGALLASWTARMRAAEQRADAVVADNTALWWWARALVDHIYRHGSPETMPPPPERITRND